MRSVKLLSWAQSLQDTINEAMYEVTTLWRDRNVCIIIIINC